MVYPSPEHPPTRDGLALTSLALGAAALLTYLLAPLSIVLSFAGLLLGVASNINYHNTISKVAIGLNVVALIAAILIGLTSCSALFAAPVGTLIIT